MTDRAHRRAWRVALPFVAGVLAVVAAACGPQITMYHFDTGRSGAQPSAPDIVPVKQAWSSVTLDGLVYGEPLVYANRVYVATENDTVYALSVATGAVVWSKHLGSPVAASTVPCPLNVDPLGITGTPVIDPANNTIYVVAELAAPVRHELIGLDTTTGAVKVDVSGDPAGVDKLMDHQRPALTLANGRVYWAYGGADCGTYHGKVVSVKTDGSSPLVYTVPSINRGSLWAASGPAVDPNGNIWVATGDGTSTTVFDHTTSLVKLSPTLRELGYFAPANWATLNAKGHELGSAGPMVLPNGYMFAMGKNKVAFVVRQSAPGGIGGQVSSLSVGCLAFGGSAYANGMIYVGCSNGTHALSIDSNEKMKLVWSGPTNADGAPVVGGGSVWAYGVTAGVLYALNPSTGAVRQSLTIGPGRSFTTPTIAGDTVLIATNNRVQAFRHNPAG